MGTAGARFVLDVLRRATPGTAPEHNVRLFVQSVRDAFRIVGERRRWKWALLVVLALVITGLEAAGALLIYVLITLIGAGEDGMVLPVVGDLTARFPGTPVETLQAGIAALVAAFFLLRAGAIVGQTYVQARIVQNAGAQIATRLVRGYLAMPYLFHTQRNSAELVRNAFDSAQRFVTQVMMPLVKVMAEAVLVLGLLVVLLVVSPMATLLGVFLLGPAIWVLLRVVQPRLKVLGQRSQASRQGSLQALQQALGGFRDIRLLGQEDNFAKVFERQRRALAWSEYLKATLAELPRVLIEAVLVIVIVIVFMMSVLAGGGIEGILSTLGVFAYVGLRLQPSLRAVVKGLNDLKFGAAVVDDLTEDQQRVAVARAEEKRRRDAGTAGEMSRAIVIDHVTFGYSQDGTPALTDVNLRIRPGEFLGICGPTGGGKSTLVDLLVGLLEPTCGQITIDGKDLCGREAWWQAQLGVVSQNVFLVDDTLRRNIAFGRQDDEVDEGALLRAVSRAQLDDVIAGLPEGLETIVGERGIRLSGGQRQRVAIARALYREPAVMVFDEGTSALDTATEAALVEALEGLKAGRTLITVAHRISTVRGADRILVVADGRIVADGPYDELLRSSSLFQSLAR